MEPSAQSQPITLLRTHSFAELQSVIGRLRDSIGVLETRYQEAEAIALLTGALSDSEEVFAIALIDGTEKQDRLRAGLHRTCVELAAAIRNAIGKPDVVVHQSEVVELAKALQSQIGESAGVFPEVGE